MANMKFGSSWVVKAPCKVNGIECPDRTMGCRNDCEKYAEYKEKLYAFKRNMFKHQDNERLLKG
jgi:hypothetical protein